MPIMQQLLLRMPLFSLGLIVVGGFVLLSILGLLIVRRFTDADRLKAYNDVIDPMLATAAAMYSVLIAFVVVTVWVNFEKSNANVQLEANYLADIYRDSEALSPDFHKKIGNLLRDYRQAVVDYEWKTMARGEMSLEVERLMKQIWANYVTYQPKTATEQVFFEEAVRKLNSFRELRRIRLMDSRNGIEPLLWFVLIIGGAGTIFFTFFFRMGSLKIQVAMVGILSLLISLILFTIIEMDFPFSGGVTVSPAPFKTLLLD